MRSKRSIASGDLIQSRRRLIEWRNAQSAELNSLPLKPSEYFALFLYAKDSLEIFNTVCEQFQFSTKCRIDFKYSWSQLISDSTQNTSREALIFVLIPCIEQGEDSQVTLKAEALTDKKGGTILFVDDEPLSLKYFKASVGKYANVKTASSPDAAMEILASEGDEISVVVSDERMPRDSGVSFLSGVRKSWPSTVRVLTSAYANIDNLQHAINDAAIYRFVPKP